MVTMFLLGLPILQSRGWALNHENEKKEINGNQTEAQTIVLTQGIVEKSYEIRRATPQVPKLNLEVNTPSFPVLSHDSGRGITDRLPVTQIYPINTSRLVMKCPISLAIHRYGRRRDVCP